MKTEGEKRVRVNFNQQGVYNVSVYKIKTKFAEIINMLEASIKEEIELGTYNTKVEETYKQAIIRAEDAAMWAEKAVTTDLTKDTSSTTTIEEFKNSRPTDTYY